MGPFAVTSTEEPIDCLSDALRTLFQEDWSVSQTPRCINDLLVCENAEVLDERLTDHIPERSYPVSNILLNLCRFECQRKLTFPFYRRIRAILWHQSRACLNKDAKVRSRHQTRREPDRRHRFPSKTGGTWWKGEAVETLGRKKIRAAKVKPSLYPIPTSQSTLCRCHVGHSRAVTLRRLQRPPYQLQVALSLAGGGKLKLRRQRPVAFHPVKSYVYPLY